MHCWDKIRSLSRCLFQDEIFAEDLQLAQDRSRRHKNKKNKNGKKSGPADTIKPRNKSGLLIFPHSFTISQEFKQLTPSQHLKFCRTNYQFFVASKHFLIISKDSVSKGCGKVGLTNLLNIDILSGSIKPAFVL